MKIQFKILRCGCRGIFALLFLILFNVAWGAPDSRPNIILFLIDDMDMEMCGPFAAKDKPYTPNLDRLAREGMIMNRAYVPHTVCTPSRYAFLTGRYAGNSYSKEYRTVTREGVNQGYIDFNVCLESDNSNVGAVLAKAGYQTGFVGKYHVGPDLDQKPFVDQLGKLKKGMTDSAETDAIFKKRELALRELIMARGFSWAKNVMPGNLDHPYANHHPEWTMDAALEFVEKNKNQPFYLHYCPTLLHGGDKEWRKSMDVQGISGAGREEVHENEMAARQELLKKMQSLGLGEDDEKIGIAWMDANLGKLLDKLDELGIAKNTLIIFSPDHGRDGKGSLYGHDASQVPMIMRWPERIKAGSQCDELVQSIDLAPTYFELAKAPVPKEYHLDGRSLVPLLATGKSESWRNYLYFEMGCGRAVMTQDWKYIATRYTKEQVEKIHQTKNLADLPKRMALTMKMGIGVRGSANHDSFFDSDALFNLKEDSLEKKNLIGNPEFARNLVQMRGYLSEQLKKNGAPFGEFVPGGNAVPPGSVDKEIALVKQLQIKGKNVTIPASLNGGKELKVSVKNVGGDGEKGESE